MKKIFVLLLCLGLSGCSTYRPAKMINAVSLGMTKEDVAKIMGTPVSTSATEEKECFNYRLQESLDDGYTWTTPYSVCFRDGKVLSYGRDKGVEVTGDIKSDQKITYKVEKEEELADKLKTLNKLLSDGLITKKEFEEQKQKMLNDYTSRKN